MRTAEEGISNRITISDSAQIADIVRQVMARLGGSHDISSTSCHPDPPQGTGTTAAITDRIITAQTIRELKGQPSQVFVSPVTVITPAAQDEARSRKITLQRTLPLPPEQQPDHQRLEIIDHAQPERAEAIHRQLSIRGFTTGSAKIVLSDTPAREVHFQCVENSETAVMIGSLNEIHRFREELSPTLWVLDMKRLNFSAAVNAAVQISNPRNIA